MTLFGWNTPHGVAMGNSLNENDFDVARVSHINTMVALVNALTKQVEDLTNEVININHPHPLMSKNEVAEFFHVEVRTITNWMNRGLIPYKILPTGKPLFERKEVVKILKSPNEAPYDPKTKLY